MVVFDALTLSELISRKINGAGKFLNFYNVSFLPFLRNNDKKVNTVTKVLTF